MKEKKTTVWETFRKRIICKDAFILPVKPETN